MGEKSLCPKCGAVPHPLADAWMCGSHIIPGQEAGGHGTVIETEESFESEKCFRNQIAQLRAKLALAEAWADKWYDDVKASGHYAGDLYKILANGPEILAVLTSSSVTGIGKDRILEADLPSDFNRTIGSIIVLAEKGDSDGSKD